MSKAGERYPDETAIRASIRELMHVGSALHMFPEPLMGPFEDDCPFLDERDANITHAREHLSAATALAIQLEQEGTSHYYGYLEREIKKLERRLGKGARA